MAAATTKTNRSSSRSNGAADRALRVRVAGLTARLRAPRNVALPPVPAAWRPFVVDRARADIALELSGDRPPDPEGPPIFDSGGVWRLFQHGRGLLYTFETPVATPPTYKGLLIDERLSRGTLFWPAPFAGRHPFEFPLDELLFQHRLARSGRLEVHSCALVIRGRVWLFCGQSGAGKTTTARLWKRFRPKTAVLSDDRVVLRMQRGRPWAYGTPWHGTGGFHSPLGHPLAAVCFLAQAAHTQLVPLGRAEAGALLLARGFPPLWDAEGVAAALGLCDGVVARVPCYRLEFRKDRSAVEAVLAADRA